MSTAAIARQYSSRRMAIVNAIVEKLKEIDGSGTYRSNLNSNVSNRLKFFDEVSDFPSIHVNAGTESRVYHGAGTRDRYLNLTLRCYVNQEFATEGLEAVIEDVETVLEANSRLAYTDRDGATQYTSTITILSIDTDEGVLEPLGVGEIVCEVRY